MPKRVNQRPSPAASRKAKRAKAKVWLGLAAAAVVVAGATALLVIRPRASGRSCREGRGFACRRDTRGRAEGVRGVRRLAELPELPRGGLPSLGALQSRLGGTRADPGAGPGRIRAGALIQARHPRDRACVSNGTNCLVTCLGLSGTNETHSVVRVIGNDPLRQFLVPLRADGCKRSKRPTTRTATSGSTSMATKTAARANGAIGPGAA